MKTQVIRNCSANPQSTQKILSRHKNKGKHPDPALALEQQGLLPNYKSPPIDARTLEIIEKLEN